MRQKILQLLALPIASVLLAGAYVFSICWRVGIVEQSQFGRSYVMPLTMHPRDYTEPGTPNTFGDNSYTFMRNGVPVVVYKQLTNGFQHAFGSGLAAYELGDEASDLLFRANEYAESSFCRNSGTIAFYRDTKKDLGNNAIGRSIGLEARRLRLNGTEAERYIADNLVQKSEQGLLYPHWMDSRVAALPDLKTYGCPGLAAIQRFRRADKTVVLK